VRDGHTFVRAMQMMIAGMAAQSEEEAKAESTTLKKTS
jgi:hypothetical protein